MIKTDIMVESTIGKLIKLSLYFLDHFESIEKTKKTQAIKTMGEKIAL